MTHADPFIEDITRQNSLVQLPLKYRWEFTRRHPIYLLCWKQARSYLKGEFQAHQREEQSTAFAALLLLQTIGVTGEPIDPATTSKQLLEDESVAPEFLPGPVQPMTYRTMLMHQIMALPASELTATAALFNAAANSYRDVNEVETEDSDYQRRRRAAAELNRLISPSLDSHPAAPLYYVEPRASLRVIHSAVNRIVGAWKRRSSIPEQRPQPRAYDEALSVWDRREGWMGSGYELAQCEVLAEISRSSATKRSTLVSRYSTAFSWIIGTPYTIERWLRLFFTYHRFSNSSHQSAGYTKRLYRSIAILNADAHRIDAQSTANFGEPEASPPSYTDVVASDTDATDLLIDICELMQKGKTDEEIAHITQVSVHLVTQVRSHVESG